MEHAACFDNREEGYWKASSVEMIHPVKSIPTEDEKKARVDSWRAAMANAEVIHLAPREPFLLEHSPTGELRLVKVTSPEQYLKPAPNRVRDAQCVAKRSSRLD